MKTLVFLLFSYLPMNNSINGKITENLKEQEFSCLSTTHILISWVNLWHFIKLSCTVQELRWFSLSDFTFFTNDLTQTGLRKSPSRHTWAASWQNQQSGMYAQRRLRSAWASAWSDQSLRCPHEETLGPYYPLSAQRRLWSDWRMTRLIWVFAERTAT